MTESIVSKAATCGRDNKSSPPSITLCDIPTRLSQQNPTATAVTLPDDNNEQRQHQPFSPIPDETDPTLILPPCTPLCNDDSFDYRSTLDAITTRCEMMQHQWPLLLASFDQTCAALTTQYSDHVPQPDPPTPSCNDVPSFKHDKMETPAPNATLDSIDKKCAVKVDAEYYDGVQTPDPSHQHTHATLETVLQQSLHLLDVATQQSQTLRNLTEKSEVLLALMTRVVSAVDNLALVPSPYSMTMTTITLPTEPAPDLTKPPAPTRHPSNLHVRTHPSPWHPPLVLFQRPAQKMKHLKHQQ